MRLASRSYERRGDRVAPDAASESEDDKGSRVARSRPQPRRATPERVWLWFFLLLNLFGICGFIFSSALFFPSVATTGVMREAIDQGDVTLLEVPSRPTETPSETPALSLPPAQSKRYAKATAPPSPTPRTSETTATSSLSSDTPVTTYRLRTIAPPSPTPSSAAPKRTHTVEDPKHDHPLPVVEDSSALLSTPEPPPSSTETPTTAPVRAETGPPISTVTIKPTATLPVDGTPSSPPRSLESIGDDKAFPSELQRHLLVRLDAEMSVEVDDIAMCKSRGTGCGVNRWRSTASDTPRVEFLAANPQHSPALQMHSKSRRPVVRFGCPMQTTELVVREFMTFFFVLEPNQVELGDTYRGQKFFGNVPYGQFLLHGGRPAFFSTTGLHEIDAVLPSDTLSILAYRLHRDHIEIKLNRDAWSTQPPSATPLRITTNGALNLGNVRGGCDTNAFQGAVAEVLIYEAILSDEAVDRIEAYLHDKWIAVEKSLTTPAETTSASTSLEPTATESAQAAIPPVSLTTAPATATVTDEAPTTPPSAPEEALPRTFDPEGVFEWLPSDALLAAIGRNRDAAANLERWKSAVREKIDAVRNFAFGGPVLRQFIRERRDELLTLRLELFG